MNTAYSRRHFLQSIAGLVALGLNLPFAGARTLGTLLSDEHRAVFEKYRQIVTGSPSNLAALPPKTVLALYKAVLTHPVARPEILPKYDPDGAIGFCFGRDMTAFLLARKAGLQAEAMRSLFIVGDLRSTETPEWRFHVTKILRMTDGSWVAIDPIVPQGRPLRVQDWIKTVRAIWDKGGKGKLYVTPPYAVLPDVRHMNMPDKETGRDLIELSFNPDNKPGIAPATIFAPGEVHDFVYELTPEAAKTYFLTTTESAPDMFPFDQLVINGAAFPFRGYFTDLMEEMLRPGSMMRAEALASAISDEGTLPPRSRGVPRSNYGMKFDANFWRTVKAGSRRTNR